MATDTKAAPTTSTGTTPQTATLKQIRDASNAIVDALEKLSREDQLRALEAATSLLGLRRKPNQQQNQQQQRGGSR